VDERGRLAPRQAVSQYEAKTRHSTPPRCAVSVAPDEGNGLARGEPWLQVGEQVCRRYLDADLLFCSFRREPHQPGCNTPVAKRSSGVAEPWGEPSTRRRPPGPGARRRVGDDGVNVSALKETPARTDDALHSSEGEHHRFLGGPQAFPLSSHCYTRRGIVFGPRSVTGHYPQRRGRRPVSADALWGTLAHVAPTARRVSGA